MRIKAEKMRLMVLLLPLFSLVGCSPHFDYIYYFSELEGEVFIDNVPQKNVLVTRKYQLGNYKDAVIEKTMTNMEGRFTFDHAREYRFIKTIGEAVIKQEIRFTHHKKNYVAWQYNNRSLDKFAEIGEKIHLKCDLKKSEIKRKLSGSKLRKKFYTGHCTINNNAASLER